MSKEEHYVKHNKEKNGEKNYNSDGIGSKHIIQSKFPKFIGINYIEYSYELLILIVERTPEENC